MYRIKVDNPDLGLKVENIDLQVESEEEARQWLQDQMDYWGIGKDRIDESFHFERLELLLDQNQ